MRNDDHDKTVETRGANLRSTIKMIIDSLSHSSAVPIRLRLNKRFQPCPIEEGDEFFANGIFEFNITKILALLDTDRTRFSVEVIDTNSIIDYGGRNLDEATILVADLSRPILLAEIAPGRYNPIDGNHRIAKARRDRVAGIPARRIGCPEHVPFLTSTRAYVSYVEYWNSKVRELRARPRRIHLEELTGNDIARQADFSRCKNKFYTKQGSSALPIAPNSLCCL